MGQERIIPLQPDSCFLAGDAPCEGFWSVSCCASVSQTPGCCPAASPAWCRSWRWPTQPVPSSDGAMSFKPFGKEVPQLRAHFLHPHMAFCRNTPHRCHIFATLAQPPWWDFLCLQLESPEEHPWCQWWYPSVVIPLLTFRLLPLTPKFSFCEEFYYFFLPEAGAVFKWNTSKANLQRSLTFPVPHDWIGGQECNPLIRVI